jgi:hypothetical protein
MVVVAVIEKSSNVWSTGSNDSPEQRNSRKVAFRMVTTFPGGGGGAADIGTAYGCSWDKYYGQLRTGSGGGGRAGPVEDCHPGRRRA